jgi:chromosome segregation ATPase
VYGSSPTDEVILTRAEYNALQSKLTTLDNTISKQLMIIDELEQQLNIAKLSTTEQQTELIEVLKSLNEQKALLIEAKNTLIKQEVTLSAQRDSLAKAEAYLNMQTNELKKVKAKYRNSQILNAILGAGLIYVAAKD